MRLRAALDRNAKSQHATCDATWMRGQMISGLVVVYEKGRGSDGRLMSVSSSAYRSIQVVGDRAAHIAPWSVPRDMLVL